MAKNKISFEIKAVKKFDANELIDKARAAAVRGMEKATTQFEADTKLLTHVDTGALRRSWTHGVEDEGSVVWGAVGSNLQYAPFEDDLHGNLSTALNSNISDYLDIVADEIKKAK